MLDFFRLERTAKDIAFPVGEPFLEDLVAAELVAPDGGGYVAPEGVSVEIHVEDGLGSTGKGIAQRGEARSPARAGSASLPLPWNGRSWPPAPEGGSSRRHQDCGS